MFEKNIDIARVSNLALGSTNAIPTEANISYGTRNGLCFSGSSLKIATQTNPNIVMAAAIFNPATSGKNMLIYSIQVIVQASTQSVSINTITADPAFPNVITPVSLKIGSGLTSLASVTTSPNNNSVSTVTTGTAFDNGAANANVVNEQLTGGTVILLPVSSGIEIFNTIGTAGNSVTFKFRWMEF